MSDESELTVSDSDINPLCVCGYILVLVLVLLIYIGWSRGPVSLSLCDYIKCMHISMVEWLPVWRCVGWRTLSMPQNIHAIHVDCISTFICAYSNFVYVLCFVRLFDGAGRRVVNRRRRHPKRKPYTYHYVTTSSLHIIDRYLYIYMKRQNSVIRPKMFLATNFELLSCCVRLL